MFFFLFTECIHEGKLVGKGKQWLVLEKQKFGHMCTIFSCYGNGRAKMVSQNVVVCDCDSKPTKGQEIELCCQAICSK